MKTALLLFCCSIIAASHCFCQTTDEILAFIMGKRNSKTVRNLLLKLKGLEIDWS